MRRIPKYLLRAGMDVVHTYSAWMMAEEGADEGALMDAHRDAITQLQDLLAGDPAILAFLDNREALDYLRTSPELDRSGSLDPASLPLTEKG